VQINTMYIILRGGLPPRIRAGRAGAFVSGVSCGHGNKKQSYFSLINEALCFFNLFWVYAHYTLRHVLESRGLHTNACRSTTDCSDRRSWLVRYEREVAYRSLGCAQMLDSGAACRRLELHAEIGIIVAFVLQ
jgi:hypothetical protein